MKDAYKIENIAVKEDPRFVHLMALSLNKQSGYEDGVMRCIVSRVGDVATAEHLNKSVLHKVERISDFTYKVTDPVNIKGWDKVVNNIYTGDYNFLGGEDPDLWFDEEEKMYHLYFTLPYTFKRPKKTLVCLGHAHGKSLDSLEMTKPVLIQNKRLIYGGAKELAIAPKNKDGVRLNLVESSLRIKGTGYSTVRVAVAEDMSKSWKFGDHIFNPYEHKIPWVGGHASPGPFFSREFIDVGENKLLGVLNGREANTKKGKKTLYGMFSVGLYIYDYENGKIEWVSEEPLIIDPDARTITFASDIVELSNEEALLFAHVDDSFVRSYKLFSSGLRTLLP